MVVDMVGQAMLHHSLRSCVSVMSNADASEPNSKHSQPWAITQGATHLCHTFYTKIGGFEHPRSDYAPDFCSWICAPWPGLLFVLVLLFRKKVVFHATGHSSHLGAVKGGGTETDYYTTGSGLWSRYTEYGIVVACLSMSLS